MSRQFPAARIWAFNVPTTEEELFPDTPSPAPGPACCRYPDVAVWQVQQNWQITLGPNMADLAADLSNAVAKDPGAG